MYPLGETISIIFVVLTKLKARKIEKMLVLFSSKLYYQDFRFLFWFSISGMMCSLVFTISLTIGTVLTFMDNMVDSIMTFEWFTIITAIIAYRDINYIVGRFAFCFMVSVMTRMEVNLLRRTCKDVAQFSVSPSKVSLMRQDVITRKETAISFFSCIPLLWFLREFNVCVGLLTIQRIQWFHRHQTSLYFFMVIPLGASMLAHIFLICFVDHCNNQVRKEITLLTRTMTSTDYIEWLPVIQQLENEKKFEYTVCNLFALNKAIALSFISSLITFTVMFHQLFTSSPPVSPQKN